MSEPKKKGTISEEDVSELLQRYSPSTILALLQEISEFTSVHSDCAKIDWNALIKNTSTGISNAREYQTLWRHVAYRNPLSETIEDGAEPLSDDSDLEFELEAVPASSPEDLAEAKECVKVLLSSSSPHDSGSTSRSTVEAPLTIHTPNDQASFDPSDKLASSTGGMHIMVPVSGQKQSLPTGPSTEGLDGNGSGLPTKKKRQLWTKEEDIELIAAVQKCGEGNWANILKGDFKHNRTASQLSQRWAIIRRRQANSNPGSGNKTSSSTRSEERLAAQKAFSLAVDMPMTGSISAIYSGATQPANSSMSSAAISEASPVSAPQSLNQCQDKGASNTLNKPRTTLKIPAASVKPTVCPNPLIQAAAFAAGGRIANPSTAASLFKAAQSKNAVHIRPGGGGSLPISSALVTKPTSTSSTLGPQSAPNLRQVRPATQPPPVSFGTTLSGSRPARPAILPSTSCATASNPSTQPTSSESKPGIVLGSGSQENAERKSGVGSDIYAIDVDELLSVEVGGAGDMRLDDAVAQEGQMDHSNSPVNESRTVAEKDQLEKEATEDQAAGSDAGGTQSPVKESRESECVDNVSAGTWNADEGQLGCVEAAADEVKELSSENTVAAGSKSPVDGQAAD